MKVESAYRMLEVIGHGSFGIVNRVEQISTGKIMACKTIKKRLGHTLYEQLMREVDIMKAVCHDGIIQLYEVYESSKRVALIIE
jgi:calcium-dependent protein kinase